MALKQQVRHVIVGKAEVLVLEVGPNNIDVRQALVQINNALQSLSDRIEALEGG